MKRPVSFCRLPRDQGPGGVEARVRLILENSTVCLIVDELVCFAPLTSGCPFLGGWLLMVSLTMILAFVSFVFCQGMWLSFSLHGSFGLCGGLFFDGEFDPGSGRTLAACLTHASRAERLLRGYSSGERVSNT